MALWAKLMFWRKADEPLAHRHGRVGELAAKKFLRAKGYKFLAANFKGPHGEIDLIFRDDDCLVFTEVKARSSEAWTRPASAVNARKRKALRTTALRYLRLLPSAEIRYRFDIVEVLLEEARVVETRHIVDASIRREGARHR